MTKQKKIKPRARSGNGRPLGVQVTGGQSLPFFLISPRDFPPGFLPGAERTPPATPSMEAMQRAEAYVDPSRLISARLFVPYEIAHPLWMACFLVLTAVTFSLFGFIIGIWADSFQKLQVVPLMIVTPLTFLGGSFYSIGMLPPVWQKIALFNPVVYLVSAFRWSFYGVADVNVVVSVGMTVGFLVLCLATVRWVFKTGYKLKA